MVGGRRLGFAGGERFRLVLSPHVRLRRCSCSSGFYFCCLGGGGGEKGGFFFLARGAGKNFFEFFC